MGHIPMGVGFNWVDQVGSPWPPELMERYGLSRRACRRR